MRESVRFAAALKFFLIPPFALGTASNPLAPERKRKKQKCMITSVLAVQLAGWVCSTRKKKIDKCVLYTQALHLLGSISPSDVLSLSVTRILILDSIFLVSFSPLSSSSRFLQLEKNLE